MPNWCQNKLTISHPNASQLVRVRLVVRDEGGLFGEFRTRPSNEDWYEWSIANWGTKWDVEEVEIVEDRGHELVLKFDTAWAPPIAFYEFMESLGFSIDAKYAEFGIGFAGTYKNGVEEETDINSEEDFEKYF